MSKKKKNDRRGKGRPRHGRPSDAPPPVAFVHDLRPMERILSQMAAGMDGNRSETALDRAQELFYRAFKAAHPSEKSSLARKALDISPDCADACVLLAEQTTSVEEALAFYEQGVAAGERALGEKFFQENAGSFWGILETRPYMRARKGMADCLAATGHREAASEHYRELIRLNPNDNQGVRHALAKSLLDLGRDDELETVLERYPDDCMAAGSYSRALVAFRLYGDVKTARERLRSAHGHNRHVPGKLLGHERGAPDEFQNMVALGSPDEAAVYAATFRGAWRETPGALAWLRDVLDVPAVAERPAPGPKAVVKIDTLQTLEQRPDEVWQVVITRADDDKAPGDEPWMMMIASSDYDQPLAIKPLAGGPAGDAVWLVLSETMRRPADRDPRRPGVVEYAPADAVPTWAARLGEIGVECRANDAIGEMVQAFERQSRQLRDAQRQPISTPQITRLPRQPGEVWQIGVGRFPGWVGGPDDPRRAWIGMIVESDSRFVLANEVTEDEATPEWLGQVAARAMMAPGVGHPHRPAVAQFQSPELAASLRSQFEEWGIRVKVEPALAVWHEVFATLTEGIEEPDSLRGIVEVPGMRLEQVAGFYEAAAEFYRRAPWRDAPGDTPIRVECARFESGTWYGIVMGQMGMTLGLVLYENLALMRRLLAGRISEEEHNRRVSGILLSFSEGFETPIRDVNAAEEHGWPLAAPEAYPCVIRLSPGMASRPPLTWELKLLEGCLRAIPDFLGHDVDQPLSLTVKVAGDYLPLTLSWRLD
ncbi:MAG TPA: hypothetical protein VMV69_06280 [Pirellulales bacterium]|nr:hypothetical protein [Pirellulales bacterium]